MNAPNRCYLKPTTSYELCFGLDTAGYWESCSEKFRNCSIHPKRVLQKGENPYVRDIEKLPDPNSSSTNAKDAFLIARWEKIQRLWQRIEELEKPKKISKNSSLPPPRGFKANIKGQERRRAESGKYWKSWGAYQPHL